MSYDIYIGETTMEPYDDDEAAWMLEDGHVFEHSRVINGKTVYYKPIVKEIKQDDAPTFPNDEMTGNGNDRHPSYWGWSHFCDITGLTPLFFDQEAGLMREHPGLQPLHAEHALVIDQALKRWKEAHPNTEPGFEKFDFMTGESSNYGYDATLARLIWLDWWVKWALKNCENPAIRNF